MLIIRFILTFNFSEHRGQGLGVCGKGGGGGGSGGSCAGP